METLRYCILDLSFRGGCREHACVGVGVGVCSLLVDRSLLHVWLPHSHAFPLA
jgi:hypothetical protein